MTEKKSVEEDLSELDKPVEAIMIGDVMLRSNKFDAHQLGNLAIMILENESVKRYLKVLDLGKKTNNFQGMLG